MSVYKRGEVWWYEFMFQGQRIRESAHTPSKTIAREAERVRRRELELGINGIAKRERPLFGVAAKEWFAGKTALSPLGTRYYRQYLRKLTAHFGNRLLTDITADDIADLQRKRQAEGLSGRQINAEIGTLRAILRHYSLWAYVSGRISMLRQRSEVGRALTREEEHQLFDAIAQSRSPALYPFFVLSLDAGLRPSETRALRLCNLRLVWRDGAIAEGEIIVGRSKTDAGTGRVVPLTRRVCAALTLWLSRFPGATEDAFVFPSHRVTVAGNAARRPIISNLNLNQPMTSSSYATSFKNARRKAGLSLRFYDARHTFVTRLAENPAVGEEAIRQLAGHVSPLMLARYAHIRSQARRDAIASLDFDGDSPQNSPQSPPKF